MNSIAFCSWSGGKDSCLALHHARAAGYDVRFLLSMLEEGGERNRSHAVPVALLERQSQALGCELVTVSASWQSYEQEFIAAAASLRERGAGTAVFGDIDLLPHREWEERVCARAGVMPYLPIWEVDRRAAVEEFLGAGFKARVICVNEKWLDGSFCGREFDRQFLADLPAEVDWCGENGEFHTFVYDGPLFREPVPFEVEEIYGYQLPESMGAARFWYARLTTGG